MFYALSLLKGDIIIIFFLIKIAFWIGISVLAIGFLFGTEEGQDMLGCLFGSVALSLIPVLIGGFVIYLFFIFAIAPILSFLGIF